MSGECDTTVEATNRMIRVQFGITDEFSDMQIPGINLALYSDRDGLIYTWTSSGSTMNMESLDPGAYYLLKGGDRETRYDVRVLDSAEIQTINLRDSYLVHYIIYAVLAILGIVGLTALIVHIVRKRKRKNAASMNQT